MISTGVNGRWTQTTNDGLGRPILTKTGYGTTTVSQQETVYGPCGCTPLGKMMKTGILHDPLVAPNYTVYTYYVIGRTTSVKAADGASTTSYQYSGNTVTVTDPALKSKTYKTDILGHLVEVDEPSPSGGGGAGNSATFVKTDSTTQGNWKSVYGSNGYNVIDDTTSYPGRT